MLDSARTPLTFRQRWASYLAILVAVLGLAAGFVYRSNVINATYLYDNPQVGIAARYPARWLLEENDRDVVFRARDTIELPFKTTLQIRLIPTGEGARAGDILNLLDMDRAARLTGYRSLERLPLTLPDGRRGTLMYYAYAFVGTDPFLQNQPITVRAEDVVLLRTGQAVVITFESAADTFEANRHYFDSFLASLSLK